MTPSVSSKLHGIFLRMPHPARQAATWLAGLRNRGHRYGPTYRHTRELLAETETWQLPQLEQLQSQLLERLLVEAVEGTEHYREAFAFLGPRELEEIAHHRQLERLPVLPKSVLKEDPSRFFSRLHPSVVKSATSGSTGSPLEVCYDRESIQTSFAFLHHHWRWMGIDGWPRSIRLTGRQLVSSSRRRPPVWLANSPERMLLVSTYHLHPDLAGPLARRIQAYRPQIIEGYPSAVATLGRLIGDRVELGSLRAVQTTAETLTEDLRASIETDFGVKVYDYYAASEGAPLIQECSEGSLHLRLESGMFELLNDTGEPVEPGEPGELTVTSFRQWKTPLIRYRTGDVASLPATDRACSCGRAHPVADRIWGREEDLVITTDGRPIGMFAYRTLKHVHGMVEAQIVQESPTRFRVVAVPEPTTRREDLHGQIHQVFERALGYSPELHLELVTQVPRSAAGKFRPVIRAFDPKENA